MIGDGWNLVWHDEEMGGVRRSAAMRAAIDRMGEKLAADARGLAPRSAHHKSPPPGHGADSIHSETIEVDNEWEAHVSWDQLHAYMRFPERRHHFLRRVADPYTR